MAIANQRCDRCHGETYSTIMSMFNTELLCDSCKKEERARPDYHEAVEADCAAIRAGNYNFPGIGLKKEGK